MTNYIILNDTQAADVAEVLSAACDDMLGEQSDGLTFGTVPRLLDVLDSITTAFGFSPAERTPDGIVWERPDQGQEGGADNAGK